MGVGTQCWTEQARERQLWMSWWTGISGMGRPSVSFSDVWGSLPKAGGFPGPPIASVALGTELMLYMK